MNPIAMNPISMNYVSRKTGPINITGSNKFISFVVCLGLSMSAWGQINVDAMDDLPPGEQYRQLSLVLLIAGGTESTLTDAMLSLSEDNAANETTSNADAGGAFNTDTYQTPLTRIVDQQSMLNGAAILLRYANEAEQDIVEKLIAINMENPMLISRVDMNALTEDAIIIRNAIADSISYSSLVEDQVVLANLQNYRTQTIYLRNIMEFDLFNQELERLTDEAIASVGGKLGAYQRMFDEEVDSKEFDRHFDAAAHLYQQTEKFDEKAGQLTEEIMKQVIFSEGQVDTP